MDKTNVAIQDDRLNEILQKLTPKQRKFVLGYDGSPVYAVAKKAGYKSQASGWHLMRDPLIREAIDIIKDYHIQSCVIQPSHILQFWAETMLDIDEDMKHRLRASENIARFHGILKGDTISIDNKQQTAIQIVLPESTPAENREEVERLKRALPAANIEVSSTAAPQHKTKPEPLTEEDVRVKLEQLHTEQALQEIL